MNKVSNKPDLALLARLGAETRLSQLRRETDAIFDAYPELRNSRASKSGATRRAVAPGRQRRSPKWSKAMREAAAKRMRKYWAVRLKAGK